MCRVCWRLVLCLLLVTWAAGAHAADYLDSLGEAAAYIELGRYNEAGQAIEKAFASDDSDPLGHMALGTVYLHVGKLAQAEAEYKAVVAVSPDDWHAHYALGIVAILRKNRSQADAEFAEAHKLADTTQEPAALARYQDYLAGRPRKDLTPSDYPFDKQVSAMTLIKAGDKEQALRLLSEVIATPAPPGFEETRAPVATFDADRPVSVPGGRLTWKPVEKNNAPEVSGIVVLTADASKLGQVSYVTYYVDDAFVGVTNYQPFRFEWNTANFPNGVHKVRIEGTDQGGGVISKKEVWVRIVNANPKKGGFHTGPKADEISQRLWHCIRLTESRKIAHYQLARLYLEAGNREDASKHFEYTVAYQPNYMDARKRLNELSSTMTKYAEIHTLPQAGKLVALTFDDGPNERTMEMLQTLAKLQVPATFFVVGFRAEAQPELMKAILDGGHEIENHTYNHPNLTMLTVDQAETELAKCSAVIRALTGKSPRFFRPPGGNGDEATRKAAARRGLTGVYWTVNCNSYEGQSHTVLASHVISNIKDGAVVLMHNGEPATNAALPLIVNQLRKQGYKFVTISELAAAAAASGK